MSFVPAALAKMSENPIEEGDVVAEELPGSDPRHAQKALGGSGRQGETGGSGSGGEGAIGNEDNVPIESHLIQLILQLLPIFGRCIGDEE